MTYRAVKKEHGGAAPQQDHSDTTNNVAIAMDDEVLTHPRGRGSGEDGRDEGERYADHEGSEDVEDDDVPLTAGGSMGSQERVSPHVVGAGGGVKKAVGVEPDVPSSPVKEGAYVGPPDAVKEVVLNSRAAMRLFELLWTVLAIFFVAQLLHLTGYIPQHGKDAANLIQQTKVWMAGDPNAKAWDDINSKSQLLDTLNSTVFTGMFRTHITHIVFHSICTGDYRRRRLEEVAPSWRRLRRELEGDDSSKKGDLPAAYQPGADVYETMVCDDLPTVVPHKAGLWMFTVSSDPKRNQVGCPVQHDPREPAVDKGAWNEHYKIGGTLGTYSLPDSCTASKTMEVMDRGDNPNITMFNDLVDWVDANFQHNTQALIVLMQLYFEPKMKWDTFVTLLVEKDISGRYLTSHYYLARDYRPAQNVHSTRKHSAAYNITIFVMLAFFAWWAGGITKSLGCEGFKKRYIAFALFPWPFYQSFTAVQDFPGQSALVWILALPYLFYTATCIITSAFSFRYNTLSKENRRRQRQGAGSGPPPAGPPADRKDGSGLVLPADTQYTNMMLHDREEDVDAHTHTHTRTHAQDNAHTRAEEVKQAEGGEGLGSVADDIPTPTASDTHTPTHAHTHSRGVRSATEQPLLRSMSAHHTKPAAMMHDLHAAGKGRALSFHPKPTTNSTSQWEAITGGNPNNLTNHRKRGIRRRTNHGRPEPVGWARVAQEYATDVCVLLLMLAIYILVPLLHDRAGNDFLPYVLWLLHVFVRVSVRAWKYICTTFRKGLCHSADDDGTHAHTAMPPTHTRNESVMSQGSDVHENAAPRYDFTSPVEGTFAWDMVDICLVLCSLWMFVAYAEFVHNASNIRSKWELSGETAAFMAARGAWLSVPFSLVLFLVIVRTLRYLEIFPILAVPWATFTRCLHELLAYSVVFVIITMSFSLLFMFNLGGDTSGVSGLGQAMMTILPNIFGGNSAFMTTGVPTKQSFVLLINIFYAFTTVFFVTNILLALVLAHYEGARNDSNGVWIDHNLLEYAKDKIQAAKRMAPHRAKPLLDRLENRVERHSIKLRRKLSVAGLSRKPSVDFTFVGSEVPGWMPPSYMPPSALGDRQSSVRLGSVASEGDPYVRIEQLEKQLSLMQQGMKRQDDDRTEQRVLLERISSLLEKSMGSSHDPSTISGGHRVHSQQDKQRSSVLQEIEHDGKSSAPQLT